MSAVVTRMGLSVSGGRVEMAQGTTTHVTNSRRCGGKRGKRGVRYKGEEGCTE
jgi:hypothetical protein